MTSETQDKLVEALFQALYKKPAQSHVEIAMRLSAILGREFPRSHVCNLLAHSRANSERYGWIVPHASRGRGLSRYVVAKVKRGDDARFDNMDEKGVTDGGVSTIKHTISATLNLAKGFEFSYAYVDPSTQRIFKSLSRRLKNISEDAAEVFDFMKRA